jgi:outer membrane protein OmpA-like peptidoglycan-associated protein/uncharacterized protein YegP (UPF0339 family)
MEQENYLQCSSYEGKAPHPTEPGFTAFQDAKTSQYFFALLDADGKVLLKSEGYPQESSRENGIQSVKKNRANREFYSIKKEHDGTYYVSLRAANHKEIARSCTCATEADARALLPYLTGEQVRTRAVVSEPERAEDDYLVCGEYRGHKGVGTEYSGLVKFTHRNGQHYFAWYDDNGDVLMRSEGYPTTAARDNGMASVAKNREVEERYTIEKVRNFYFVVLKAGNHQEIARSCPCETEEAARKFFPSARRNARNIAPSVTAATTVVAATAAATTVAAKPPTPTITTPPPVPTPSVAPTPVMAAKPAEPALVDKEDDYIHCKQYRGYTPDAEGFARFKHTNGLQYFVWYDSRGEVLLRSEGHPHEAELVREQELVRKYRFSKDRYEVKQVGMFQYVILRAPSGEEIGRSCPFSTLQDVYAAFPLLAPPAPVKDKDDDYLRCEEYEGHKWVHEDYPNMVMFTHANGKHYFAVMQKNGKVMLRGEGHLTKDEVYRDMDLVKRYMNDKARYELKELGTKFMYILRDDKGTEIARTCPLNDRADFALFAPPPKPAVTLPPPAPKIEVKAPVIAEPPKVEVKAPVVAAAATVAAATVAAKSVTPPPVEVKAPAPIEVKAPPPPTPKVTIPEPPPIPRVPMPEPVAVEASGGKFPWWAVALPLLALAAWWLWPKEVPNVSAPVPTPPVAEVKPEVKELPKPEIVEPKRETLRWILFDFDRSDLRAESKAELDKMAGLLKEYPGMTGLLRGHTDWKGSDAYNIALSQRRVGESKQYLIAQGIEASRIETEISGEQDPIAKNEIGGHDTEQGRQFNRRVELYVKGGNGKLITVESIPPEVPAELRAK